MNIDKQNNHHKKKDADIVQEPKIIYGSDNNSVVSDDFEITNPVLEKLVSKSIQDSKEGKGISNEEMNQKIRSKYPFLK